MKPTNCKLLLTLFLLVILSLAANAQRGKAGARAKQGGTPAQTTSGENVDKPAMTKPTGKHLTERQKGNIKQLETDLTAIKQGSQVTPDQKENLKNSLTAMADGATKPDPAAVQKLADDLSTALADGRISAAERYQLSEQLEVVMNSANISQAEFDQAVDDAAAIFTASGIDKADVETLVYDMKQISAEGKKTIQKGKNTMQGAKKRRG